jgi:hypothetical protein
MNRRTTKLLAAQDVAKALDEKTARRVERLLLAEHDDKALELINAQLPELPEGFDIHDSTTRNHLLDFLDPLLMPSTEDGEDIEDMKTMAMPNYETFARDLREESED